MEYEVQQGPSCILTVYRRLQCGKIKNSKRIRQTTMKWSGGAEPNRTIPNRTKLSWAAKTTRKAKSESCHDGGWMDAADWWTELFGGAARIGEWGIGDPGSRSQFPYSGWGGGVWGMVAHTEAAARPLSHATDQMTAAQDATRITDGAQTEKNQKEKRQRHGHRHWDWHKPEAESENKTQSQCLGAKPIKAGQHVSGILCPLNRLKLISYNSNLQDYSLSCLS